MTENDIKDRIDTIYGKSPDPRSAVAAEKYGFTQGVVWLNKLQPYTYKDMEAFAEWFIGRSEDWITDEERCETAETFIEMWEKERGEK